MGIDQIEEFYELILPVALVALTDDFSGCRVQSGKQSGCAMPGIIIGLPFGQTRTDRKNELAAIQIQQATGVRPLHPLQVLERAYREDGFEFRVGAAEKKENR